MPRRTNAPTRTKSPELLRRIREDHDVPAYRAKKHRRRQVLDVDLYGDLVAQVDALARQKPTAPAVPVAPQPREEITAKTWDEYEYQATRATEVPAPSRKRPGLPREPTPSSRTPSPKSSPTRSPASGTYLPTSPTPKGPTPDSCTTSAPYARDPRATAPAATSRSEVPRSEGGYRLASPRGRPDCSIVR